MSYTSILKIPSLGFLTLLFGLLVSFPVSHGFGDGQDTNRNREVRELPKNAVARFGDHGKEIDRNGIYVMRLSPDGKYLATRQGDQTVRIYDIAEQKQLCEINGYESWVGDLQFAPNSSLLVTSGTDEDDKIKVWRPDTGELVREFGGPAKALKFSPAGKRLITAGEERILIYDFETGKQTGASDWKRDVRNSIFLSISNDGKKVATTRMAKTPGIEIRGLKRNDSSTFLYGNRVKRNSDPKGASFSPNGRWVAGRFMRSPHAFIWDLDDPSTTHVLEDHEKTVQHVVFSPDSRLLATCSWDHRIVLWDVLTATKIGEFQGHEGHVCSGIFSGDSRRLATGASGAVDCSVIVWDTYSQVFRKRDDIPEAFDAAALARLWTELGSDKPRVALDAVDTLSKRQSQTLNFVLERVKASTELAVPGEVERLIADLDSDKYKIRAAAQEKLLALRSAAESLLQKTLERDDISVEVRYRINTILRHPVERPKIDANELRRMYRVVFAMELIDTDPSREILQMLALGHQHSYVSREAASALERLTEGS